jgi:hypothetical protein
MREVLGVGIDFGEENRPVEVKRLERLDSLF